MQTEMEAKDAQLQQKDTQLQQKDGQIQQQGAELQEKATQISRQQRELQTLRVRNWCMRYCLSELMVTSLMVVRRIEDGCRQRWRLNWYRLKRRMLKSTD